MKKTMLMIICMAAFTLAQGQSISSCVVASGGGDATTENGTIAYTIGESVISWAATETLQLSEGFWSMAQQPTNTTIEQQPAARWHIYPNPVVETLHATSFGNENTEIMVSDLQGRILFSTRLNSNSTAIDFSRYQAGVYIVTLKNNEQTISQRIVKH